MSERILKTLLGLAVVLIAGYFLLSKTGIFKHGERDFEESKEERERQRFEEVIPSTSPSQGVKKQIDINFSKEGNLVKDQDGSWALLYEEPGQPALQVRLVFVNESVCDFEKGGRCDESLFEIGDRVRVEGDRQDNTLIVAGMSKLSGE